MINFLQLEDMPELLLLKNVYVYFPPSPKGQSLHVMFGSAGPRTTQTAEFLSVGTQNHFPDPKKLSFPKEGGM